MAQTEGGDAVEKHDGNPPSPQNRNNAEENEPVEDLFAASGGGGGGGGGQLQSSEKQELIQTLKGGPALIFELARRSIMFVHDFDDTSVSTPQAAQPAVLTPVPRKTRKVLPRWHPHGGISDANPQFRTKSPAMNNQGFAKSIWRNVRKRNKPQLWRQALRTYDRMAILESDADYGQRLKIQRSNVHHEGAMLACAKLGQWQRALEIYHYVWQQEKEGRAQFTRKQQTAYTAATPLSSSSGVDASPSNSKPADTKRKRVSVTDNMILSLVKACVRASRMRSKSKSTSEAGIDNNVDDTLGGSSSPTNVTSAMSPEMLDAEAALRRIPLDTAQQVLSTMQEEHSIPLVAYFVNPLAAAYQSLGYVQESRHLLQTMLSNRTAGEEPENGKDLLNVHDLCAKDKGSYSLMVQGAVATGDWGSAVEALRDMTNAGLYPNQRHNQLWSETSERQTRPRFVGSRKKKRDDYWTDSVR